MSAPRYHALISVGDNLAIDGPDLGPGRGAASLFYKNRDSEWPEFRGRDLVTRDPSVRPFMLAQDKATIGTTLTNQLKRIQPYDEPVLVIVTVGGLDILGGSGSKPPPNSAKGADALYEGVTAIFEELGRRLSDWTAFATNIPAVASTKKAQTLLQEFNDCMAEVAHEQSASLIDICGHFEDHGPKSEEPWIQDGLALTPFGANELRRLFWNALTAL